MNSTIASSHSNTFSPKTNSSKSAQLAQSDRGLSKVARRATVIASVLGSFVLSVSGQAAYAPLPLSISALLLGEVNRRRLELLQKTEQSHKVAVTDIQQRFIHLENQLEYLQQTHQNYNKAVTSVKQNYSYLEGELKQTKASLVQMEAAPQKYLTKTHLTPLVAEIHQLQRQHKEIELGQLGILMQQVNKLQQQLDELESSNALADQKHKLHSEANNLSTLSDRQLVPSTKKLPHRPPHDRVAIFVDQANLHHAATDKGIKIDYAKLLCALKAKSAFCQAFVYIAVDPNNKNQPAFLSRLKQKGFQIISKPIVQRADGSVKGNLDLELGLDLVNRSDSYDTAVLVSGDADFVCAVKQSRGYGKRVEVASFRANTSFSLIEAADRYLDLETIQNEIR